MKLTLKNFRCHRNGTWEFPPNGLCLLEGVRGRGKSTILNAILYSFFGSVAVKQPCTFGENKATVILEFDSLRITRTSRPRRLVVWLKETQKEYEDVAGQSVIERWLNTTYEEFKFGCYISQKSNGSILSLSPQEQLRCIEKIILKDGKHDEFINTIKLSTKKIETNIQQHNTTIEINKKLIEEYEEQLHHHTQTEDPKIDTSYDITSLQDRKTHLTEFKPKLEKKADKLRLQLEEIKKKEKEFSELKTTKQATEITIRRIEDDIRDTEPKVLDFEEVSNKERILADLDERIEKNKIYYRLKDKKQQLQSLIEGRSKEIDENLGEINGELETLRSEEELNALISTSTTEKSEYTKQEAITEIKRLVGEIRKTTSIPASIKSTKEIIGWLNTSITKITKNIDSLNIKLQKVNIDQGKEEITSKVYKCPKCDTSLKFEKEEMVIFSESLKKNNSKSALSEANKLRKNIKTKDELKEKCLKYFEDLDILLRCATNKKRCIKQEEMDELNEELKRVAALGSQKEMLLKEREEVSTNLTVIRLQEEIKVLETQIDKDYFPSIFKELQLEHAEVTQSLCNHFSNQSQLNAFNISLSEQKQLLAGVKRKLRAYDGAKKAKNLEDELENIRKELENMSDEIANLVNLIQKCKDYDAYERLNEKRINAEKKMDEEKEKLEQAEIYHQKLLRLKELSFEAEMVAIQHAIEDLNAQSQYYLDMMFDEDPISVRLESVKETKQHIAKLQMNVSIEYSGYKYDTVEQLSGGERDQANLSFVLGLNRMLGSKFLILDECLASLDGETNTKTLTLLKEELSDNILVLVVSHEAVRGNFDHKIIV